MLSCIPPTPHTGCMCNKPYLANGVSTDCRTRMARLTCSACMVSMMLCIHVAVQRATRTATCQKCTAMQLRTCQPLQEVPHLPAGMSSCHTRHTPAYASPPCTHYRWPNVWPQPLCTRLTGPALAGALAPCCRVRDYTPSSRHMQPDTTRTKLGVVPPAGVKSEQAAIGLQDSLTVWLTSIRQLLAQTHPP